MRFQRRPSCLFCRCRPELVKVFRTFCLRPYLQWCHSCAAPCLVVFPPDMCRHLQLVESRTLHPSADSRLSRRQRQFFLLRGVHLRPHLIAYLRVVEQCPRFAYIHVEHDFLTLCIHPVLMVGCHADGDVLADNLRHGCCRGYGCQYQKRQKCLSHIHYIIYSLRFILVSCSLSFSPPTV